jgi:hypothetical protein
MPSSSGSFRRNRVAPVGDFRITPHGAAAQKRARARFFKGTPFGQGIRQAPDCPFRPANPCSLGGRAGRRMDALPFSFSSVVFRDRVGGGVRDVSRGAFPGTRVPDPGAHLFRGSSAAAGVVPRRNPTASRLRRRARRGLRRLCSGCRRRKRTRRVRSPRRVRSRSSRCWRHLRPGWLRRGPRLPGGS